MAGNGVQTSTLCVAAAMFLAAMTNASLAQREPKDVTITYDIESSILLEASGPSPVNMSSHDDLARSIEGTEKSQCQDYGRRSSGSISTSSTAVQPQSNALSSNMRVTALAMGGHYRTCAVPCDLVNDICVGTQGHDTRASASGAVHLRARIAFSSQIVQDEYDLKFFFSHPEEFSVRLTKPDGSVVAIAKNQKSIRVSARRSDIFYIDASLLVSATNTGGCCSDAKEIAAQFDIRVEKTPILLANAEVEPYIVGGKQTNAYKYVVAILIDASIQCTGTVISKHTILTAAHCIHGFEQQIKDGRVTYLIGGSVSNPDYQPAPILDGTYPRRTDSILYDPVNYIHDIGLLFTSSDIPVSPPTLHVSLPAWADIEKQQLLFVGFGYNKSSEGDFVGPGIKREASWQASEADDWRFYYKSTNKHACQGDSGGPAFYMNEDTRELILVGITSVGDKTCTGVGADTRVDAHHEWLVANMR